MYLGLNCTIDLLMKLGFSPTLPGELEMRQFRGLFQSYGFEKGGVEVQQPQDCRRDLRGSDRHPHGGGRDARERNQERDMRIVFAEPAVLGEDLAPK